MTPCLAPCSATTCALPFARHAMPQTVLPRGAAPAVVVLSSACYCNQAARVLTCHASGCRSWWLNCGAGSLTWRLPGSSTSDSWRRHGSTQMRWRAGWPPLSWRRRAQQQRCGWLMLLVRLGCCWRTAAVPALAPSVHLPLWWCTWGRCAPCAAAKPAGRASSPYMPCTLPPLL